MFLALAGKATVGGDVRGFDGLVAVHGLHGVLPVFHHDARDAGKPHCRQFFHIGFAVALDADHVHHLALDAVFAQQFVETVRIARLEKDRDPAPRLAFFDQVFRQVCPAEIVVDKACLHFLGGAEHRRGHIIRKLARRPAEHTVYRAGFEEFHGAFFHYFLHRKSSSLLFSPSAATVSQNSFMVLENLAPSAAEIHSTRVRSFSMPR